MPKRKSIRFATMALAPLRRVLSTLTARSTNGGDVIRRILDDEKSM
jgi:hypothetical protein